MSTAAHLEDAREVVVITEAAGSQRGWMRSVLATREGRVAIVLLALFLTLIVLGPILRPYSPTQIGVGPQLAGPSEAHLLGTDDLGRDVLSRVLSGGGEILWIPLAGVSIAFAIAVVVGTTSAYRRGAFDAAMTRITDVALALPPLLLTLVVIAGAGRANLVVIVALAIVFAPRMVRVVRGAAQAVTAAEYVDAAAARGETPLSVALREVLPNLSGPLAVEFAVRLTQGIIFVATLSFLGLGAQPPSSNWGLMIADGRSVLSIQPWIVFGPVICLAVLAIGINLLADAASQVLAREDRERG
jgi:peptide/nickel transport system permease protein